MHITRVHISTPSVIDGTISDPPAAGKSRDMELQRHHLVVGGRWCIAGIYRGMWELPCAYAANPRMRMTCACHVHTARNPNDAHAVRMPCAALIMRTPCACACACASEQMRMYACA